MTAKIVKKTKSRLWKNADLLEAFAIFNRGYFGDQLAVAHLAFSPIDGLGKTVRCRTLGKRRSKDDPFAISISSKLRQSRRLWAGTLLHEMVHLEQRNKYSCAINGHHFNRRMKKLAADGAFDGLW